MRLINDISRRGDVVFCSGRRFVLCREGGYGGGVWCVVVWGFCRVGTVGWILECMDCGLMRMRGMVGC